MTGRPLKQICLVIAVAATGCDDANRQAVAAGFAPASAQYVESQLHEVSDPALGGLVAFTFMTPADWRAAGEVRWNYADSSLPVRARARANAADGSAWVEGFPTEAFYWTEPPDPFTPPGARTLGMIHQTLLPVSDALLRFVVEPNRGRMPGFRVVSSRPVAHLAESLGEGPVPGEGCAVRVAYEQDGSPVEEEFFALRNGERVAYHGPLGTSFQNNWRLVYVHSLGARDGRLDERRPELARIAASFQVDPLWQQQAQRVFQQIQADFDAMIAQGYAQIEAAGRLSRQISAQNDSMLAGFEAQRQAQAEAATRSDPSSSFSQYIRGVENMQDPYWGESEQSYQYKYHWTDGSGTYRHSNDSGFNPNIGSSQNWQLMEPAG